MEGRMNASLEKKKGRNRWEIIRDILRATLEENRKVKKTRIMQKAYLDWRTFNRYFEFLMKEGFISKSILEKYDEDKCIVLTEKGRIFLNRLKELEEVLT